MKKFLVLIFALSFFVTGCNSNNTQEQNNSYNASRIIAIDNTTNDNNTNTNNNIESIDNINTETELSSFSTKIYTPDDDSRQNNIRITCSKLNGTVIRSRRNIFFL